MQSHLLWVYTSYIRHDISIFEMNENKIQKCTQTIGYFDNIVFYFWFYINNGNCTFFKG